MLKKTIGSAYFERLAKGERVLFIAVFTILVLLAIVRGYSTNEEGDFYVFWNAGKNYFSGEKLYLFDGMHLQFLYPPFAAAIFGLLAVFPFSIVKIIFSVCNIFLWVISLIYSIKIIEIFSTGRISNLLVGLSFVFTFNFFLMSMNLVQVNMLILVLVLLFVKNYFDGKYWLSSLFLSLAIILKVTPIVFVGWILLRGKLKCLYQISLFFLGFFLLGIVIRGGEAGVIDYKEFLINIIDRGKEAETMESSFVAHRSLKGMFHNYLLMLETDKEWIKNLFALVPKLFAFLYIVWLAILRLKKLPVSIYEIGGTFILILLISPITADAHMVFLLLPIMLLLYWGFKGGVGRKLGIIALASVFVAVIGKKMSHFMLDEINIYTLAMILIYSLLIVNSFTYSKLNMPQIERLSDPKSS